MAKANEEIKILHSLTGYILLDVWGISSEKIKDRTSELESGGLNREQAFKRAMIEKSKRLLNG